MLEPSQAIGGEAPATAGQDTPSSAVKPPLDPIVAALCRPIAADDPDGPDLDEAGDADYLNFFAQVEGILPASFFSAEDGKPFDPSTIDVDGHIALADELLKRTRDVRLLTIRARLLMLNRDIAGFAATTAAIAECLEEAWDTVHPRGRNDDFSARSTAVSALNIPTVVFALQYTKLLEARPAGLVTYRAWMIATGETKPRPGDSEVAAAAITEAIGNSDPAVLTALRQSLAMLRGSVDRIRNAFSSHGASVDLDNLGGLARRIIALVDPQAAESAVDAAKPTVDGEAQAAQVDSSLVRDKPPASIADATDALAAIADYYSRSEPSSPILPLVRQAHQLIGKSFLDVITILMPSQVDKAAFQIGTEQVFELPVGKLAGLSAVSPSPPADTGSDSPPSPGAANGGQPRYRIQSRAQALALLDLVQRYFRQAEPSSPIPMLCERARALAQRDFMGVLRDVMPKSALKAFNADKA